MHRQILKGNIIEAPELGKIKITEHGYLVSEDGKIVGVFEELPEEYLLSEVTDYGNALIMQSHSDMHLHAPQYPMLGMGMDLELLEWLNKYTFPMEAKFSDADLARSVYRRLAKELLKNGTTRVCIFSSLHYEATVILMEELEAAGIFGYAGKVNMDRNSIPQLCESTEESKAETLRWLSESKRFENIKPILTPRFTPSCTDELMAFLGELAMEYDLPVQSHLSENKNEIAWVKELHPDTDKYYESYKKFGLWNEKTLMAHCVYSDDKELSAMREDGVFAVHCADSNNNLCSGTAPVRKMLDMGVRVVLGSDIAGGDKLCGFDIIASSIRASKVRSFTDESRPDPLSTEEAWYLMTSSANEFFGEGRGFAKGNRLGVMVIDDTELLSDRRLTPKERFERCIYNRQAHAIVAVYSGDKIVYKR